MGFDEQCTVRVVCDAGLLFASASGEQVEGVVAMMMTLVHLQAKSILNRRSVHT